MVVGEASDLLESVAGVRDDVRGHPRGGHRVRASLDGVSDVTLAVGRQQRRACPVLPRDFVRRCGALGSATLVHVPNPAREELCAIFCDGLEGMLDGDDNWSKIAQCTHRLLLGAVPKGVNPTSELRTRLRLWRTDCLEELLTRREQQRRGIVESRHGHTAGHHIDSCAKRAERLAREGARSKAIGGLRGGVKSLPAEEQRTWAAKLIPTSERGDGAFAELRPVDGSQGESALGSQGSRVGDEDSALKGISFAAMSAAGPSGARHEHLRSFLRIKRKCVVNRLLRVLETFLGRALGGGDLPGGAHWILHSQLTFLCKPGSDTPRLIRVGDHLRRLIGKRLLVKFGAKIRKVMLDFLQFGVSVPGGAEALIHTRRTVEEVAALSGLGAVAVVDVDLINCFGMFEWPATLDAVGEHLPELEPWLRWCTTEPDHVRLPCGDWVTSDRGAGQGEPEGPLKAALTIGQAVGRARADLELAGMLCPGAWWWYIDDGQLVMHPTKVDCVLRALDRRLEEAGASRGSKALGHKVKSSVHIPEDEVEACCGWRTDYIDDTCEATTPEAAASKVLGVEPDSKLGVQFAEVMAKVVELHKSIEGIRDAGVETVLKTECVGCEQGGAYLEGCWGPTEL